MNNTGEHQIDLLRFLALCIDMRYGQEGGLEEIWIG